MGLMGSVTHKTIDTCKCLNEKEGMEFCLKDVEQVCLPEANRDKKSAHNMCNLALHTHCPVAREQRRGGTQPASASRGLRRVACTM